MRFKLEITKYQWTEKRHIKEVLLDKRAKNKTKYYVSNLQYIFFPSENLKGIDRIPK